jgi:hypothetical protein
MAQVTWRAPDELVRRVREAAARAGRSMNEFLTRVLDAATDPALAGSDAERMRKRLARAGLLAAPGPPRSRPAAGDLERARAAAGEGTPLSGLVSRTRE